MQPTICNSLATTSIMSQTTNS